MASLARNINHFIQKNYKKASTKALSVAVSPSLIGAPPVAHQLPTFYVLDEYSRANSLLLQNQTEIYKVAHAIKPVHTDEIFEDSAMIFLKHRRAKNDTSPRLVRLIEACLVNPNLDVNLVPVTILWGRAPEKEDSLFKLLMADEWRVPSISKQLFNIGVMGRDTFVQFFQAQSLQALIKQSQDLLAKDFVAQNHTQNAHDAVQNTEPDLTCAHLLSQKIARLLHGYLFKQRASILGPDLSDKRAIKADILQSDAVQKAIADAAISRKKSVESLKQEVADYVDEIASDYSYSVVRAFDRFLTWLWTQLYDGVQIRHFERVRALAPDHQIIYVPCHRSHMDYLLLSYVIFSHGLRVPHVAAGANLNIPIVGELLRSGGAFFLRRSFRDNPLYGTVFKEYLHNLMQRAAPIEYFIEGGRSRSGRLLAPKLGMLAMTIHSHLRAPAKPVVFIPTYISYERIMEGATYVGELKGAPKQSESIIGLLKTAKKIKRVFGTVNLGFGEPLFLTDFMHKFNINKDDALADSEQEKLSNMIENVGIKIMQNINKAAVVNPVSLLALALLSTPKGVLDEAQLIGQLNLYKHIATALPYDSDTFITDMTPMHMVQYGQKLGLIVRTEHVLGNIVKIAPKNAPLLSYFKNNILHVFIIASLLCALVQKNKRIATDTVHHITALLYPFLQAELFLKFSKHNIAHLVDNTLQVLVQAGVIIDLGSGILATPDGHSDDYHRLTLLSAAAQESLERYFMALTFLSKQGSGRVDSRALISLCHIVGARLSILHGENLPDTFDKALFAGFIKTLIRGDFIFTDENEHLCFDERIDKIARFAKFALHADALQILQSITELNPKEVDAIIAQEQKTP